MRRLFFLVLIFIIIFCVIYPRSYSIETFDSNVDDGFTYYLLKKNSDSQMQVIERSPDVIIFNIKGTTKLEPIDPSIYGELIIDNDKMDYNGEIATVSYYKRRKDYITITFNNNDPPITFSHIDNTSSISHKNSEIGTIEEMPDGNITFKFISHPDATKYIAYVVGGYLYWQENH